MTLKVCKAVIVAATFAVWLPVAASAATAAAQAPSGNSAAFGWPPAPRFGCLASPQAAINCFVIDGVATNLMTIPPGMTLQQYEVYSIAVWNILQSDSDTMVLVGMMSAVADAMPPTNSNGSPNQAAQNAAVNAIVEAMLDNSLITLPAATSQGQMQAFAQQLVARMNPSGEISLSPGVLLRVIDSYVVKATSSGAVNWTSANNAISAAINSLVATGIMKIPSSVQTSQVDQFASQLAQIIYAYKQATGKGNL
jgi:hypothetical protein